MGRYERKYTVPRARVHIIDAVLKAMKAAQFSHERPTFRDDREARMYARIVRGAQAVAMMEEGEGLHPISKSHLSRMNVLIEDGRVRRWGWLSGPWLVRAYGHSYNWRVADVHEWGHPQYVKPDAGAAPEA
jgi:hypothetical protein